MTTWWSLRAICTPMKLMSGFAIKRPPRRTRSCWAITDRTWSARHGEPKFLCGGRGGGAGGGGTTTVNQSRMVKLTARKVCRRRAVLYNGRREQVREASCGGKINSLSVNSTCHQGGRTPPYHRRFSRDHWISALLKIAFTRRGNIQMYLLLKALQSSDSCVGRGGRSDFTREAVSPIYTVLTKSERFRVSPRYQCG